MSKGVPIGVFCKICHYFTTQGHLIIVHEKETGHKEWTDAYLVVQPLKVEE